MSREFAGKPLWERSLSVVESQQSNNNVALYPGHQGIGPQFAAGGMSLEFILDFVRRRLWLILFSMLFMCGLGFTYFVAVPAPYTGVATLAIDTRKFQLFQQSASLGDQSVDSAAQVESQLEVLKSEKIALKVISELHLADDPEFGYAAAIPIVFISNLLERRRPESEIWRTRNALRLFDKRFTLRRRGMAYVIDINFESLSPDRAAQIANAIAHAYITDQFEAKYEVTREGSKWLEGRIRELRDQVSAAEKAVNDYKARNNIVETGKGRLITEQQLSDLNTQLSIARAKTSEMRARLDRMNEMLNDPNDAAVINATINDGNNPLITKLRTQYLELAAREVDWSEKYGRNHLAAVNARNTMRG